MASGWPGECRPSGGSHGLYWWHIWICRAFERRVKGGDKDGPNRQSVATDEWNGADDSGGWGPWYIRRAWNFTEESTGLKNLIHLNPERSVADALAPNPSDTLRELGRNGADLFVVGNFVTIAGSSGQPRHGDGPRADVAVFSRSRRAFTCRRSGRVRNGLMKKDAARGDCVLVGMTGRKITSAPSSLRDRRTRVPAPPGLRPASVGRASSALHATVPWCSSPP